VRDMIAIVRKNGRSGWYLRVLAEGYVEAGQAIRLVDRPNRGWTVRRAAEAYLNRGRVPAPAAELARCRGLSEAWRSRLEKVRLVL
jgi:MOSC domain-containing protein YiiM